MKHLLLIITMLSTFNINAQSAALSVKQDQDGLFIPKIRIKTIDINGEEMTPENSGFVTSFEITQDILKRWKSFGNGTVGIIIPKKHVLKNRNVAYHSNRYEKGNLQVTRSFIETSTTLNRFQMSLKFHKGATCLNKKTSIFKDSEYSSIQVENIKTSCSDLFNFSGTREEVQARLDELPLEIVCKYEDTIDNLNTELELLLSKEKKNPLRRCYE